MDPTFIHSNKYDFQLYGIEKLHPFDGRKYSRAWAKFIASTDLSTVSTVTCDHAADDKFLLEGHSASYLDALKSSKTIAQIIEVPLARFLPNTLLRKKLVQPARYACYGTWLATQAALQGHIAMNFGGGYHHAFADHGEGFCFFADAALSIKRARKSGLLDSDDKILMIDLDAHRGNGFESYFNEDETVKIFDMYNFQIYPGMHPGDVDEFPYMVPLRQGMQGSEYLKALKEELPSFLDSAKNAKLVFYNAGTDIVAGDTLGCLDVSFQEVIERDRFVLAQLKKRGIPCVVMTSGGYSDISYELIAKLALSIIEIFKKE